MPKIEIKGLRGLKSFSSLSADEYNKWRRENSKYLHKYSTAEQEEQLYNTQRFAKTYGKDKARQYSYDQRLAIEKQDIQQYNNSIIQKTAYDTFSPFRDDGSVDPNKGVGDISTFWKIMNMDPVFQKELLESPWLTNSEIDKAVKDKNDERFKSLSNPVAMATESGQAAMFSWASWGKDAEEKIDRGANKNIFDNIYAKDLAQKNKQASANIEEEYNKLNIPDEQINQEFIRAINPTDKTKIGVPQLAAFFNEDGSVRSSEVNNLSMDDKKRWIAKINAYSKMYDPGTVYDMLDKEAKDYINEHQDWMEYAGALLKDMRIGASAYTADKINGIRAAYISMREKLPTALGGYDTDTVKAWGDDNGRFWGKEYLERNEDGKVKVNKDGYATYIDPYSGERIPVKQRDISRSALDAQGIAPDGTTRGLFFNNRYWSDAEATGMFSREEQAKAKALNGYSPSKAVYKMGEDKDYLWEVAKMAQFAAADAVSNLVPSLGIWGGAAMMGSRVANSTAMFANEVKDLGRVLYYTSKAAQAVNPTFGAVGIGHAYGRGVFGETLEGNMAMVEDYLRKGAEDRFHSLYEDSDSEFSSKERTERVSKRNAIEAEIEDEVNNSMQKIGAERLSQLSEEELYKLTRDLAEEARIKVSRKYINEDVEQMRKSPEYDEKVTQAAESATSAALTAAWTTGIKYALVNNFGYRSFLFKDPLARVNSSASKILKGAVEDSSTGKLSIVEKFANASKRVKWKEVGKVTASQMWGGGWTNFTDELQSAGARQMNADRMGAYLNDDYDAAAQTDLLGGIGSALSYLRGMSGSLSDASTWNAGLVGALGSVTSVAPNVASLASGRFRSEWNKAESWQEKANLLISNGILNTYYDKVLGERQAKETIEKVNKIIDDYDSFKALGRGIALDMASMDATNPHDKDAIDFVKAVQLAYQLNEFSNDRTNQELLGTAQRSSVINNALETVDKVLSDKFTEEDARDYLSEYYARNPSVAQSEANNAAAMETIKSNAEKLKTGIETYQKVDEAIKRVEKSTGTTISPLVKARLVERFALDQFLTDRIAEVEEGISGNRNVTAGTVRESFGTDKALNARISDIQSILEGVKKDISDAKTERDARKKKAKDYLESKQAESEADLTEAEQKEYGKLIAERDAADMQVRALEEQKRSLTVEGDNLINLSQDKSERRVLSSEEILRLSPADRARMLDDRNFEDYSAEQQEQITRARAELSLRDPQLLSDVQHQAFMVQRRTANAKAYDMMLNNPEAAAAQLDSSDAVEYRKYMEALNRRRTNAMDTFIKGLEDAPSSTPTELEDILYNQLLGFGLNQTRILEGFRDSANPRLQKYSHVFEKAVNTLNMMSDVKSTINSLELSDVQQKGLTDTLGRMIASSASQQELLDKIGSAIESPDVSAQDKALLNRALTNLEEVWGQKSATVTRGQQTTDQTAEADAQEEARAKAAEDAARKAAEEASKPDISEKDADTSNDADAELAAHGLTKDDTKTDSKDTDAELAAHGLTKEDLTTDNESSLTPEQLADIARSKEGNVDLMESPTIEEQAAENPEKVEIRPVPKDDGTEQGNKVPMTATNLIGNTFFRYYETIRDHGYEELREGKMGPNDPMNNVFNWLKDAGVNMQRIIDDELGDIAQTNPDIHIMYINPQNNATKDTRMQRHSILVVEYTPEVSRIHNDKNGGVFQANGKQYLMIGILGYQKYNNDQKAMWSPVNDNRESRVEYFKNNPGERFFIDQKYHTKIDRIGSGWLVRRLVTDNETKIRRISELLRDEDRNPKGLDAMDLKWYIQQGNDIATVHASERNKIHYDRDAAGNTGSVFLLIEGSNGEYIPAYVNPVKFSEIKEGSKLKNEIERLFSELTSTDHKRRLDAVKELRTLVVLKDGQNDVNIGTEDKPKLSVFSEGVKVRTFHLSDAANDRDLILQTLRGVDFRINVTTSVLSTQEMFDMYDEAGALTTDLAKLGTSNASFSVYAMDSDGNPIISTPVENNSTSSSSSDLSKSDRKDEHSVLVGGKTYREWDGQWHDKNDNVITDERLIEQLHYNQIIKTRDLKPNIVIGQDEVFILNSDRNNPLVIKRKEGTTFITQFTKEGSLKMIDRANQEQVEQAKRERLKKQEEEAERADQSIIEAIELLSDEEKQRGADRGERVDLNLEEHLTDQQLMDQMNGNFNSDTRPEETHGQKKAQEVVEKIMSDTADIVLSTDGSTYEDVNTGQKFARVTSVIAADKNAGERFGKDNPWGLPSATIGTGIDEFVRDFFANKIGNRDNLADRYPNASNEQLKTLAEDLDGLKEKFDQRGLTVIPRDITVSGTVEVKSNDGKKRTIDVAGTLDLLAYDKDGNFYIFDMKSKRSAPDEKAAVKWSRQLTLYKQLLEQKYGVVVKGMEIIPIQVRYNAPKGWGNATTEYTAVDGKLYANGVEYRDANPILHDNIPRGTIELNVQYSRLTPAEQAMVKVVEGSKPTPKSNKSVERPIVQSPTPKTSEDINKTGSKSLAELQAGKSLDTALAIMKNREYGSRVRKLLKEKFPDMPSSVSQLEGFLTSKGITVTGIKNVEQWIQMIEECK